MAYEFPASPTNGETTPDGLFTYHDPPGRWESNSELLDEDLVTLAAANNGDILAAIRNTPATAASVAELQDQVDNLGGGNTGSDVADQLQTIGVASGTTTVDLALGHRVLIASTSGTWTPSFTNVPTAGANVTLIVNVTNDNDEMTFSSVDWSSSALGTGPGPVTADWDAGETNVFLLRVYPYLPTIIADWIYNGTTPSDPGPLDPATLTAQYSTSADRSSPSTLASATVSDEVAVFFGPTNDPNIAQLRVFSNFAETSDRYVIVGGANGAGDDNYLSSSFGNTYTVRPSSWTEQCSFRIDRMISSASLSGTDDGEFQLRVLSDGSVYMSQKDEDGNEFRAYSNPGVIQPGIRYWIRGTLDFTSASGDENTLEVSQDGSTWTSIADNTEGDSSKGFLTLATADSILVGTINTPATTATAKVRIFTWSRSIVNATDGNNSTSFTKSDLDAETLDTWTTAEPAGGIGTSGLDVADGSVTLTDNALPAQGAESLSDAWVRNIPSGGFFDLLGGDASAAVMWDTNVDPTGNNRDDYDENGSASFTVEQILVDGVTDVTTFSFSTGNAGIGADPTRTVSRAVYAPASASHTVTIPDGVDRLVVVHIHYRNYPSTTAITGITLGGNAMTILDSYVATGSYDGSVAAYIGEASLTTGNADIVPTWNTAPNATNSVIGYEVRVYTNMATPTVSTDLLYENSTAARTVTVTGVDANSALFTSADLVDQTATITPTNQTFDDTYTKLTGVGTWLDMGMLSADVDDSGTAADESVIWTSATAKGSAILTAVEFSASGGGGGTEPITPGTPTAVSTSTPADNQLLATYSSATNAVSYEVRIGTSNPFSTTPRAASGTTYTFTGLAAGTVYYWQARGVSSDGTRGAWSTVTSYSQGTPTGDPGGGHGGDTGKFVSADSPFDVAYQEGKWAIQFPDMQVPNPYQRSNPPGGDWTQSHGAESQIPGNYTRWANDPYRTAFQIQEGPRLIITLLMGWAKDADGNVLKHSDRWTADEAVRATLHCALNSKGELGKARRPLWEYYADSIKNATTGGLDWTGHVFTSVSHESNGPWSASYWGVDPKIIGDPRLTAAGGATIFNYGDEMAPALWEAGETGNLALVHKLAYEWIVEVMWAREPKLILGMTPATNVDSIPGGETAGDMSSAWVTDAMPAAGSVDFLCPTYYVSDYTSYTGGGTPNTDVNPANYTQRSDWMQPMLNWANNVYGCPGGALEFGGRYALGEDDLTAPTAPGERTSCYDGFCVASFDHIWGPSGQMEQLENGVAFANNWMFATAGNSNPGFGTTFHILEGCWGRVPSNEFLFESSGSPDYSSRTQPLYPLMHQWFQDNY